MPFGAMIPQEFMPFLAEELRVELRKRMVSETKSGRAFWPGEPIISSRSAACSTVDVAGMSVDHASAPTRHVR